MVVVVVVTLVSPSGRSICRIGRVGWLMERVGEEKSCLAAA